MPAPLPSAPASPVAPMRAPRLVAWVRAWRAGLEPLDDAVDAVREDDADHVVADLPGRVHVVGLHEALGTLSTLRPEEVRLVLPAPGDPRGLPGPGPFTAAALVAGEGAVCGGRPGSGVGGPGGPGGGVGLVPEVEQRVSGSGDVWHTVTWRAYPVAPAPVDPIGVAEAEQDLVAALREATDLLRDLDVARWRPELAGALLDLRRTDPLATLPHGYDPRAQRLVARAELVCGVVALAGADAPGGAVTSYQAAGRDAALRPLATAARRARMAAYNSPLR